MPTLTTQRLGRRLLLASLVCAPGCGGSSEVGLLIHLPNLPARAASLEVTGSLDGIPAIADQKEIQAEGLSHFGIRVPATARGSLSIDLTVYDSDRCNHGTSSVITVLPTPPGTQVTATIQAQSPRRCAPLRPCPDRTLCSVLAPNSVNLWGAWAFSGSDIWAVGNGSTVLHWDGQIWTTPSMGIPTGIDLQTVWASAPDDIWVGGVNTARTSGFIYHFDGSTWKQSYAGSRAVNAIHGTSRSDVFAVGGASTTGLGELRRWNSTAATWDSVNIGTVAELLGVWVNTPQDIWAVGSVGTFLRIKGTLATSLFAVPPSDDLYAVHGYVAQGGSPVVYAVGANGLLARYDGSIHSKSIGTSSLYGVLATPTAVYVTSVSGTVQKSMGISDVFTSFGFGSGSPTLHGVHAMPNGLAWIVGDNGFQGYIDTRP